MFDTIGILCNIYDEHPCMSVLASASHTSELVRGVLKLKSAMTAIERELQYIRPIASDRLCYRTCLTTYL